ncbi:SUMF1/EgtB/PvdO family nonheme iron enzyme [Candidatus Uabimicrobium amorphum]|uniref:WD40 domain-containing protein n=1 Tax=Uabimicrobium amorphum TaxID=2596890 RepID=UPI0034A564E9
MKKFILFTVLLFVCLIAEDNHSQQALQKWIDQLQSKDRKQQIHAIKELRKIGNKAYKSLPELQNLLSHSLENSDQELFWLASQTARDIGASVSIKKQLPLEKTKVKSIQEKQRTTSFLTRNLGGLNVLGASSDFRQRLRYGKRHALVIGINKYQHYTPLEGPSFDAGEVASILTGRYGFENVVYLCDTIPQQVYRQHNLTLVGEKENEKVYKDKYGSEKIVVATYITKAVVQKYLDDICREVNNNDSLMLFYAGHGVTGYLVPADSTKNKTQNLSLKSIGEQLSRAEARHTLMVLDCCFGGSILQDKYKPKLEGYSNTTFQFGKGENIDRVFARRAFQIITAGTGNEAVADKLGISAKYAQLTGTKDHSPFSAVFLQALKGLTGRADGIQLVSDLGYYMMTTLVNDDRLNASQTPRYANIGDGDFMFFPKDKVLNPKLIAPLYLDEKSYTDIRISSCEALKKFIIQQKSKKERIALTKNAIVHINKLLKEEQQDVNYAAIKFIDDMVENYVQAKEVDELRKVIDDISDLLDKEIVEEQRKAEKSTEKQKEKNEKNEKTTILIVANVLKKLGIYANEKTVLSLKNYVINYQKPLWQKNSIGYTIPMEVHNYIAQLDSSSLQKTIQGQMLLYSHESSVYEWLNSKGIELVLKYDNEIKLLIEDAQIMLNKSQLVRKSILDEVRKQGTGKSNYYSEQDINDKYEQCGAYANKALELLEKIKNPGKKHKGLIEKIKQSSHEMIWLALHRYNSRFVWQTTTLKYSNVIKFAVFSPDGKILASASGASIQLSDAVTGRQIAVLKIEGAVNSVAFSPNGKVIVSASDDKSLCIWDVESKKQIAMLKGHSRSVNSVAFSPDGKIIASGSNDKSISIWDVESKKQIAILKGHSAAVNSVAFSPNGKIIASGSNDKSISLWNKSTSQQIAVLLGHSDTINTIVFSPNGKVIASGSQDQSLNLWDVTTGKQITDAGHTGRVNSVAFSPNGKIIASCSDDKSVRLWSSKTGKQITLLSGHTERVNSVAFSPNGKTIASASFSGVKLFNIVTRKVTEFSTSVMAKSIAFSPDGETLASASSDMFVRLWDTNSAKQIAILERHTDDVNSVAFSPDGKFVISASSDRSICLWKTRYENTFFLSGHKSSINSVAFSPDGKIIASCSDGRGASVWDKTRSIRLWDTSSGKQTTILSGHTDTVNSVAFSPDGKFIASCSEDRSIILWDTTSAEQFTILSGHTNAVNSVVFSPDGKIIASCSDDRSVRLWDVSSGKQTAMLRGNTNTVHCVIFSPDGKIIASASRDKSIRLWDTTSAKQIAILQGHTNAVNYVTFSPDGKFIASASNDNSVRLWDSLSGKQIAKLQGHTGVVNYVAFSPNGRMLASTSRDKSVRLWDTTSTKQIAICGRYVDILAIAFSPDGLHISGSDYNDPIVGVWDSKTGALLATLEGHTDVVNSVVFSPDGKFIASASRDKSIRLWDTTSAKQLVILRGHTDAVNSVVFSPDGKFIASASKDKSVRLWDVYNAKQIATFEEHTDVVNSVAFSPDGKILVSVSNDKSVRLCGTSGLKQLIILRGHTDAVNSVVFSPDGKILASASKDKSVRLWDVNNAKQIATFEEHTDAVNSVAFSPDSKIVMTKNAEHNTIQLWDVATCKQVSIFPIRSGVITSLLFSPDGNIVSCLRDMRDYSSHLTIIKNSFIDLKKLSFFYKKHKGDSNRFLSYFGQGNKSYFSYKVNSDMTLSKKNTQKYFWSRIKATPSKYPWTNVKAHEINRKLRQAYINKDKNNIKKQHLEYLLRFNRKDYIETVADIYTWQGNKTKAKMLMSKITSKDLLVPIKIKKSQEILNEESVIKTLKLLSFAENLSKALPDIDQDDDGDGEYRLLAELQLTRDSRTRSGKKLQPMIKKLGTINEYGFLNKYGYYFQIFLPSSLGKPLTDSTSRKAAPYETEYNVIDMQEQHFRIYAWPIVFGEGGRKAFSVDSTENVIYIDNVDKFGNPLLEGKKSPHFEDCIANTKRTNDPAKFVVDQSYGDANVRGTTVQWKIVQKKQPQKLAQKISSYQFSNELSLKKWTRPANLPSEYLSNDKRAFNINTLLQQALWKQNKEVINYKDIDYLSHFTRHDYIETVACTYAWLGMEEQAKEVAKRGLPDTQILVKLLLLKFSFREIEQHVKDNFSGLHEKLHGIYTEEKLEALSKRELAIFTAFIKMRNECIDILATKLGTYRSMALFPPYIDTLAMIHAWLGNEKIAKKFVSSSKLKQRVPLLLKKFTPKQVESICSGELNKRIWELYLDEKVNKINQQDFQLLHHATEEESKNTVATIYDYLDYKIQDRICQSRNTLATIYAYQGNVKQAIFFAKKATLQTPIRVELLLSKFSPKTVENLLNQEACQFYLLLYIHYYGQQDKLSDIYDVYLRRIIRYTNSKELYKQDVLWKVFQYYRGKISEEEILLEAKSKDVKRRCQVYCYLGMLAKTKGQKDKANKYLQLCLKQNLLNLIETRLAKIELRVTTTGEKRINALLRVAEEELAIQQLNINISKAAPQGWESSLWELCWNAEKECIDFTVEEWGALSHEKQVELAHSYQEWYAQVKGLELTKEIERSGAKFVLKMIPPGKFWMGSPQGEKDREDDEVRHKVWVSEVYYVGETGVMQGQWSAVMGSNPSEFKDVGLQGPVESVSWEDCAEFCKRVGMRLLTEAEWEYACRAGTTRAYNLGDSIDTSKVCFDPNWSGQTASTVAVKSLPNENSWGCYDFHGNVWEWCSDRYGDYSTAEQKDPKGSLEGWERVLRGGCWKYGARECRSALRFGYRPGGRDSGVGLRLCVSGAKVK